MLYSFRKRGVEVGCDEAGRGCLAGPVFAAAVILPRKFRHSKLNDSKVLSDKDRQELRTIIEREAISYSVQSVDEKEIDKINILNASIKAMHLAIGQLNRTPDLILVDGNRFKPYAQIEHQCIIKGDSKYASIAAASILAKTYRDEYMMKLSTLYPGYGWEKNKGYATLAHRVALQKNGPCEFHRRSFHVKKQLTLFPGKA